MNANDRTDRLPPFNLEAEQSVLGCCLLDCRMVDECAELLQPKDFFREDHGEVFATLVQLRERGGAVDALIVADELTRQGRYAALGGNDLLRELVDSVPHAANAQYYAGIVREKAIRRRLLEVYTEGLKEIYAHEGTAAELVERAESRIFALGEAGAGVSLDLKEVVESAAARVSARERGEVLGLATGFADIDMATGGFHSGSLVILAARPSQGKTTLALDIMRNVAARGELVLMASLEMSHPELGARLISAQSRIPARKLEKPWTMTDRERYDLTRSIVDLCRYDGRIDDAPIRTVSQIAALARRTKHQFGLSLIMIDYLGLIDGQRTKGESRQEEVAGISRRLKGLAREIDVPVLALHQLNRQSEQRADRRPMLSDLRDSGQLEADADLVMLLHRPEFYDSDDRPGQADLIVAKNRNGPTGTIRLAFTKECTRFDSFTEREPEIHNGQPY